MSQLKFKSLFVCFYFPPFNRVGGRRWAKHLKFLSRMGNDFWVLAGGFKTVSPWDDDIKEFENKITRIPIEIYYPYYKRVLPINFSQKLKWKISFLFNTFLAKKHNGNFWDDSRKYENDFFSQALSLIRKHNINFVCLSVGPFSYSRILIKLRYEFPDLKIMIDYRDPWEDIFDKITSKQVRYESLLQKKVVNSVDIISTVNEELKDLYTKLYPEKRVFIIPHSFDIEDLSFSSNTNYKPNKSEINIIYGGALYEKIEDEILLIKRMLIEVNKFIPTRGRFYTSSIGYENLLNNTNISRFPSINQKIFFSEVQKSDFVFLILPENRANSFSSKFYELLALKKPILYFGPIGKVSNFIAKNKLGFHFTEYDFDIVVKEFLTLISSGANREVEYPVEKHSFEYQTIQLVKVINKL